MTAPTEIKLHAKSATLELRYADGHAWTLPAEFLRVHSPSAEVQGHGPGQEVLQFGKKDVSILDLELQGRYAIKITFSDGHDTGLFTWDYLERLGATQDDLWATYVDRLAAAGKSRDNAVIFKSAT